MGSAWQKAKRSATGPNKVESACIDRESYPQLSAFLGGVPSPDGKGMDLAAHTLTLFVDNDLLCFCLQSKGEPNKVFGGVPNMFGAFDAIEKALEEEKFSVRKANR